MIKRNLGDRILVSFFWISGLFILLVLVAILAYLIWRGGAFINIDFLLGSPEGYPLGSEGGILPAIKGTLWLILLALIFSIIPGLATAVYLSEYGRNKRLTEAVNVLVQSMMGIPSIVVGLFVYALCVVRLGWGISLLAGGVALGLMVFPVIVVSSRNALLAVDDNYRLVARALGVSESYIFWRVILPRAVPGILAGILLALGYAAGATAPIMVTATAIIASSSGVLLEPVMALPYHLYILFNEHMSLDNAYATALVLVLMLVFINALALWLHSIQERNNA
ncbi:MAG: phosphate ABC transporter permease PstA [Syntrophomonadaceae bacterium]|nr:phosphate ABC transporter permease PstA [Syntrophomonadaceae bacterium]